MRKHPPTEPGACICFGRKQYKNSVHGALSVNVYFNSCFLYFFLASLFSLLFCFSFRVARLFFSYLSMAILISFCCVFFSSYFWLSQSSGIVVLVLLFCGCHWTLDFFLLYSLFLTGTSVNICFKFLAISLVGRKNECVSHVALPNCLFGSFLGRRYFVWQTCLWFFECVNSTLFSRTNAGSLWHWSHTMPSGMRPHAIRSYCCFIVPNSVCASFFFTDIAKRVHRQN